MATRPQYTVPSEDELREFLLGAKRVDGESLLSVESADRRAKAIVSALSGLRFELRPFYMLGIRNDGDLFNYPCYRLNTKEYSYESSRAFCVEGPGLSQGDLLRFGLACEMKQTHIPGAWPKKISSSLEDHNTHNDTVEELVWLSRFMEVTNVVPNDQIGGSGNKDVDWSIQSQGIRLHLEVKYKKNEWSYLASGSYRPPQKRYFSGIDGKFGRKYPDALNLICVSTACPPDDIFNSMAQSYIIENPEVDAVVVFSYGRLLNRYTVGTIANSRVLNILRPLFINFTVEDSEKVMPMWHIPARAYLPGY